jgi:hypothetical protein
MVLKTREKVFVGVALLVGLAMIFDTFITRPKEKKVAVLKAQVQEYNEKLSTLTTSMTGLQRVKKRVEEKRKAKELFSGRITDVKQIDLFLEQVGKESQKKHIDLVQLTINYSQPGAQGTEKEKASPESIKKVTMDVELLAGFGAIGSYLDGLQLLPIFLEVEKVDISQKEGSASKLQVSIQQSLYLSGSLPRKEPGKANVKGIQPVS